MGADGISVLAVGFGRTSAEAAYHARTSSMSPFETIVNDYSSGWRAWQSPLRTMERHAHGQNIYRVSANILRVHEAPDVPRRLHRQLVDSVGLQQGRRRHGGLSSGLAPRSLRNRRRAARVRRAQRGPPDPSLSPGDPGGRRIVAAKLLAGRRPPIGAACSSTSARSPYCSWTWPGARARWPGRRTLPQFWPMVERAARFVFAHRAENPSKTCWEENAGYTPFTLAADH